MAMTESPPSATSADASDSPGGPIASGEAAQPSTLADVRRWLVDALPRGQRVSDESFAARHLVARLAIAILVVILLVVALANGDSLGHAFIETLPVTAPGLIALRSTKRLTATLSASWSLMASASVLVHQTDGLIEAHFLFFVLLPLVALYQDWRAFLGAIGYVLVSHAAIGVFRPESMYNHPAAVDNPVKWAGVHAIFVAALVVILVIEWNFAENDQKRTQQALVNLRTTQDQLLQAQKLEAIGQLAAGVAHEINTPVQYLSDNTAFLTESFQELTDAMESLRTLAADHDPEGVEKLLGDADLDFLREEIPQALGQSMDGLNHVAEIVRAMKDFSHPGSELGDADLNKVIKSTATVSTNEWKYVADLELDLEATLPPVRCHEGQIKQVILNMIVNASHAIRDAEHDEENKGTIRIGTSSDGDHVTITIADSGCGMSPEIQKRIFDQFFTTKEVGRGTGQGLAMAHDIITSHAGTIGVDSTPGAGTTFSLRLPTQPPDSDDNGDGDLGDNDEEM